MSRRLTSFILALLDIGVIGGSRAIAQSTTQPSQPAVDPSESIVAEYNPQAPPNPNPPPYTLLRFNEDYRYLANPQNRTDPFDRLKYIPLNPDDPNSYLSFGGELRERYEHFTNPGFANIPASMSILIICYNASRSPRTCMLTQICAFLCKVYPDFNLGRREAPRRLIKTRLICSRPLRI